MKHIPSIFLILLLTWQSLACFAQSDKQTLEDDWLMPIHGQHISQHSQYYRMVDKNSYQRENHPGNFVWGYLGIRGMSLTTNSNGYIHTFIHTTSIANWDEIYKRATCLYGPPDKVNDKSTDGTVLLAWLTEKIDFRIVKLPVEKMVMFVSTSVKLRD